MLETSSEEITFREWIGRFVAMIRRNLRLFVIVGFVSAVIGVTVALILPDTFEAKATILPPSSSGRMSGMLAQLGALSGIASIGGGGNMGPLYPDIIKSFSVLQPVLYEEYEGKPIWQHIGNEKLSEDIRDRALVEALQGKIHIKDNIRTGLLEVSYSSKDPQLSAAVVNDVLESMDNYLRFNVKNEAVNQIEMIESRLAVVKDSLRTAENELKNFREANRVTAQSPALMLTEGRLRRSVEIWNQSYIELSKQLELVKIQESGSIPVLNVLDYARPPLENTGPPRKKILMFTVTLGLLFAVVYVFWKQDAA